MGTPLKKVLRDFRDQKLRTVIVVVSITVGVFCITGVGTISAVLTRAISDSFASGHGADITILTSSVDATTATNIAGVSNVSGVEGRVFFQGRIRSSGVWYPLKLTGVNSFSAMQVDKVTPLSGSFPQSGQIMIETTSGQLLNTATGQKVQVQGSSGTSSFVVSGEGRSPSTSGQPAFTTQIATAFMNASDVRRLSGAQGVNEFFVTLGSFAQKDSTVQAIVSTLQQHGALIKSFTVRDPSHPTGATDIANKLSEFMTIFGVIALFLSGMLVINTLSTVVSEQTPVIGSMKAVGASSGQVVRTYLTLGLLYGICGTILGLVLGVTLAYEIVHIFAQKNGIGVGGLQASPSALLQGILVGMGITLIAALIPAWRGSKITVREAISSYGIGTAYKPSPADTIVNLMGFLSRPSRMSVRNTFRRKGRLALTLAPLALAGAILLGVGSTAASLNSTVALVSGVYRADTLVTLGQSENSAATVQRVQSVSGVSHVEAWYQTPIAVSGHSNVQLAGVPDNTQSYHVSIVEGRWLASSDSKVVVLSNAFARNNGLSVGQTVTITPPNQASANWQVIGTVNDQNNNGSVAFAPLSQVQALGGETGLTNYLFVTGSNHSSSAVSTLNDSLSTSLFPTGAQPSFTPVSKIKSDVQSQFTILIVLLYAMVFLLAIVGALGLFAVLAMNVVERRKEIGVMRSIGAGSRAVIQVFTVEGIVVGLLAALLATLLGVPMTVALTLLVSKLFLPIGFEFAASYIVIMVIFMLIVAAAASMAPAASAARLRIADVLRYG